jgi:hypothetical protein
MGAMIGADEQRRRRAIGGRVWRESRFAITPPSERLNDRPAETSNSGTDAKRIQEPGVTPTLSASILRASATRCSQGAQCVTSRQSPLPQFAA